MAIKIDKLSYTYPGGRRGLVDINLHIAPGKKTALLGRNGSGKSTLLSHFNGMKLPQEGRLEVAGLKVEKASLKDLRRRVGYIFDYPDHQLFSTTAYKDIEFGLDNYGYDPGVKTKRIDEISRLLGIEDLLDFPPFQMSLGQKKKVALAGVLVLDPQILVCDEPFSGLDQEVLYFFKDFIDQWLDEDKAMVFSTHDTDIAYEWADDVIILKEGQVLAQGPVQEILTKKETYSESGLKKPYLYALFEDIGPKPRSMAQAKKYFNHQGGI